MPRDKLEEIINNFKISGFAQFFRLKTQAQGNFRLSNERLPQYNDSDLSGLIKLGQIEFSATEKLIVIGVEVKTDLSERSGKKNQYEKAKKILKELAVYSAGIFIFYDATTGNFRFSLVYPEAVGRRREWSSFRRFTYFVSKEFTNKTFLSRIGDGDFSSLAKIKDAFSVEKVTKEFYMEYRKLFESLLSELSKNHTFKNEAIRNGLNSENFAKKLLGQIVFLYFVQKKGWLGVPSGGNWGEGNKNFMSNLFREAIKKNVNFYNDYLEPLFYDTLNNPRRDSVDSSFSSYFKSRIPFLNGGLFEPEYDWKDSLIYLDNKIFGGIFEVFDRYNFTVEEESPDDKEIAVDPEMLGKVFENLLPENLRKGKGTYYTPREIVYYMCRESLINYLISGSKLSEKKIRKFVIRDSVLKNSELVGIENLELKSIETIAENQLLLNKNEAGELDILLKDIKIVDPACGSGAFLVGMLNEIIGCRIYLYEWILNKNVTDYELKKEAIQNCIYGVDIDPGAIEIAKLRLWLSLVVDYSVEDIEPLPNLDYHLMCGNSLLEEYEGVKFYNGEENGQQATLLVDTDKQEKITELKKKVKEYFDIHDDKEKLKKKEEINQIKDWLIRTPIKELENRISNELKESEKTAKQSWNNKEAREKYLKEAYGKKFEIQNKIKEVLDTLHNPKETKPFFIWKLEFIDVFEDKKGFDVVIGNPPYVEHKKLKSLSPQFKKKFLTYSGTADLYVYFFEQGIRILKNGGTLIYISSNKFIKTTYGEKLRELLSSLALQQVIDFTKIKVFDALVASCITVVSKSSPLKEVLVADINDNIINETSLLDFILKNHRKIDSKKLSSSIWQFENDEKLKIKEKIECRRKKLNKISGVNIYRGITTGYNPAFIINKDFKNKLIKTDNNSLQIIKPLLQGRDIKKWVYHNSDYSLLQTGFDKNIKSDFPSIYKHLLQFEKELKIRDDQGKNWWNLRACKYYADFEKEKIIWGLTADKWAFAYDDQKHYLPSNGYILISEGSLTNKYLLALLNSNLLKFYFGFIGIMTAGGAYTLKHETISVLPIEEIAKEKQKPFIKIVDKILAITKTSDYLGDSEKQVRVRNLEHQIDKLVYKLYDLTEDEIKIIEEN